MRGIFSSDLIALFSSAHRRVAAAGGGGRSDGGGDFSERSVFKGVGRRGQAGRGGDPGGRVVAARGAFAELRGFMFFFCLYLLKLYFSFVFRGKFGV